MPVEALLLPLRMPLFCSFEIIALVGCGIRLQRFLFLTMKPEGRSNKNVTGRMAEMKDVIKEKLEQFVNNRKVTIKSLRIR